MSKYSKTKIDAFYPEPMLEMQGWTKRRPWQEFVFNNSWDNIEDSPC